jgi:hypothetical protein
MSRSMSTTSKTEVPSATLRCGLQRVRFTDDGCFTVEVAADHDSKFPWARTAHARGLGFQFFEVRIRSISLFHCADLGQLKWV